MISYKKLFLKGHAVFISLLILGAYLGPVPAQAEEAELSAAEVMARKLQDPLASMKAVMTDNTISFGQAGDTGYNFQVQPVYSIPTNRGFNFIPRAVIPIIGAPPASNFPKLGEPRSSGGNTKWGLGDIITQFFFAPSGGGEGWKWGVGPQVSFRTRTDSQVGGPGWGGGFGAIIVGGSGAWSFAGLVSNHWGENEFNILTAQPIIMYNFESIPGTYVGYNNSINLDWNAPSDDGLFVPLGLTGGRTFDMGSGFGLDLSLGLYAFADPPPGAADWQLKPGLTVIFP